MGKNNEAIECDIDQTIGFNLINYKYLDVYSFDIWEMGGDSVSRTYWPTFYRNLKIDIIVFMINLYDLKSHQESLKELLVLLCLHFFFVYLIFCLFFFSFLNTSFNFSLKYRKLVINFSLFYIPKKHSSTTGLVQQNPKTRSMYLLTNCFILLYYLPYYICAYRLIKLQKIRHIQVEETMIICF